jgi:hypothetical protein
MVGLLVAAVEGGDEAGVGDGGRGLGSRKHLAVDSRHIYTSEAERAMASIDRELASTSTRIQV